jgi:hypothetical protein
MSTPKSLAIRANGDANSYALVDQDNKWVLGLLHNGEPLVGEQIQNLSRLAACWNACDGFTTEQLTSCPPRGLVQMAKFASSAQARADELSTAMRCAMDALQSALDKYDDPASESNQNDTDLF